MSERALKALMGTVLGLGLLWLAVVFLPGGEGRSREGAEPLASLLEEMASERATAVRFLGPGMDEPIDLRRVEGQWRVNGFRVDSANLARFWEAMDGAEVGDLVGSNPANHPRMGLATDSVWTVEVDLPEGSRSLLVGDPSTRYGMAYVRLPGADEVYLLGGNVRSQVTRSLDDWRNKRVTSVDTAQVWALELDREEGGFSLERSDSLWVFSDGDETNGSIVKGMLGEIARLDASGFYSPGDSLSALSGTLRALSRDGAVSLSLQLGSGEGDRWARVEGDSILYRIPAWRASRLMPELDQMRGGG